MGTWTTDLTTTSSAEHVMRVLVDPDTCTRWAPVAFRLEDLDTPLLETGSRAVVTGECAGQGVSFAVQVTEVSAQVLALRADGPVAMDVRYDLTPQRAGTHIRARVTVTGRGLRGRVLCAAVDGLLAGHALHRAVAAIAREAEMHQPA